MSDDFDDDEVQHRLVIDDHLDLSDNIMHANKHNDIQSFEFVNNGLLNFIIYIKINIIIFYILSFFFQKTFLIIFFIIFK